MVYSNANSNVSVYFFDFEAPLDKFNEYDDYGLSHAGELSYNFGGFKNRDREVLSWEQDVADKINELVK